MAGLTRRLIVAGLLGAGNAQAASVAAPAPPGAPAPMAASFADGAFWPVVTTHADERVVPALFADGRAQGVVLRRFNAPRPAARADNPTRRHVGVDLSARAGDGVVAIAPGVVRAFYPFLQASTGEMSYALMIAHEGVVLLYGEVRRSSFAASALAIGAPVPAGKRIATVSDTAQLHIEAYRPGVVRNISWRHGAPPPAGVLNPTQMLLDLAETGRRV